VDIVEDLRKVIRDQKLKIHTIVRAQRTKKAHLERAGRKYGNDQRNQKVSSTLLPGTSKHESNVRLKTRRTRKTDQTGDVTEKQNTGRDGSETNAGFVQPDVERTIPDQTTA